MIVMDNFAHPSAKVSKVLHRKKRWTNEKKNRKRKITSEQIVAESGTFPENITFQLKKRKIAVKQLVPESETSSNNIVSQSNNFLSKNVLPKTKKKKRKRKKTAKHLVLESESSENIALQLKNTSNEAINTDAVFQNVPFTQSNNQETLKSSAILSPAFIPFSSQNVNTTKVKKGSADDFNPANSKSYVKIKTEATRNNDCELIAAIKPVRKINQQITHNLNIKKEPLQPIKSSHSDAVPPEQLLSTLSIKDESTQCETAPASPVNIATSISQSPSFTPEEIQFSLLQNLPEESIDHNFKSITEPVSFAPANEKDAPNVRETDNINEFLYELQECSDTNSKSSLSLEELSLCIKTIHSISSHLETKFTSKNKLLKSFTGSVKEAVKQFASSSMHQSINLHNSPEISNDFEMTNHHLESRPSEINKQLTHLVNDLTRLQILKSAEQKKEYDSSSTNPVDPKNVPYSQQRLIHSDTSIKKPLKRPSELQYSDSKSPPYVNPLDPRITTKNNSATYATSVSSTNPVDPKDVLYSQQRQVHSDTSIKKPVKRAYSELQYSDSKSPPYVNPLDPRITTKNNSATHSKSFSSVNPVDPKGVPYCQQTQIGNVEHFSSISLPVTKKVCLDYSNLGNNSKQLNYNVNQNINMYAQEYLDRHITKPTEEPHYVSNSPISDHLIHQNSTPIQLSSNNMTNFSSGLSVSQKINSNKNNSSSFVKLLPHSLIQDIGVNFIPRSYVYLIIIGWREEWFSEYEYQSKINSSVSLPPILNKSNSLSQVLPSYQCEKEHYNTYFKLLLVQSWYKLYLSWKNARQLNKEYSGKIRECVEKKEFIKYVVEYFVPATEKDNMPDTSSILQLKFTNPNGKTFSALGYVSNVMHRHFDSHFDNNNEAFKVLNVSGDNILKYKIEIITVYKFNEIDTKQMLNHKKLMNVRNVLQQNDALNNLSKSPLCKVILDPVTSLNKLSLSIPDESGSSSIPLNQICKQILTSEPLLVLVNSSLSSANKISVIHYITKNILSTKPRSKVIICSKSKNKLFKISNDLQKHGVVFISEDPVPVMQKYSLKKLMEREMEENLQLNQKDVQSKLLRDCSVITILFSGCCQCDILKELNNTYCILDNAHKFTEPVSIIPLSYGTTKFVLFGNKTKLCDVPPITANHGYNRSLFHRATV